MGLHHPREQGLRVFRMSDTVSVPSLPGCSFCTKGGNPAAYDGATTLGPWAYMCEDHFEIYGRGLGTGVGQRLVVIPAGYRPMTEEEEAEAIAAVVDSDTTFEYGGVLHGTTD